MKTFCRSACFFLFLVSLLLCACAPGAHNPLDPESPDYVGDLSANDHDPPIISYQTDGDTIRFSEASGTLSGTVTDTNGIARMFILASGDSLQVTLEDGNWQAEIRVDTGYNTILVFAVDNSYAGNGALDTIVIFREGPPRPPRIDSLRLEKGKYRIHWTSFSGNETLFVVERNENNGSFARVGVAPGDRGNLLDTSSLTSGTVYSYRVLAQSPSGVSLPSQPFPVSLPSDAGDLDGPVIEFLYPDSGQVLSYQPVILRMRVHDKKTTVASVFVNDSIAAEVTGGEEWSAEVPLAKGANAVAVRATDDSHNENVTTDTLRVTYNPDAIDAAAPRIERDDPKDSMNVVTNSSYNVIVIVSDDSSGVASVDLVYDTASMAMSLLSGDSRYGTYQAPVQLRIGMNYLTVRASDKKGHTDSILYVMEYDTSLVDSIPPRIRITNLSNDTIVRDSMIMIRGIAADDSIVAGQISLVRVKSDTIQELSGSNWETTVKLDHGENVIAAEAFDKETPPNRSAVVISVIYNLPPAFSVEGVSLNAHVPLPQTPYEIDLPAASDPDGDPLTYTLLRHPTGADTQDNKIRWPLPVKGTGVAHDFRLQVNDGWDQDTIDWTVTPIAPTVTNTPPRITSMPADTAIVLGGTYQIGLQNHVDDHETPGTLTYTALSPLPERATLTYGVLSWAPSSAEICTVKISASDGDTAVTLSWVLYALPAPVFTNPPADTAASLLHKQVFRLPLQANIHQGISFFAFAPGFPLLDYGIKNDTLIIRPNLADSGNYRFALLAYYSNPKFEHIRDTAYVTIDVAYSTLLLSERTLSDSLSVCLTWTQSKRDSLAHYVAMAVHPLTGTVVQKTDSIRSRSDTTATFARLAKGKTYKLLVTEVYWESGEWVVSASNRLKRSLTGPLFPCPDGKCDSAVVQVLLDTNEITAKSVATVTEVDANRRVLELTNALQSETVTHVPGIIGKLSELDILKLGKNAFTSLPEEIGHFKKLTRLYVHSSKLTTLPASFGNLQNLKWLNMGACGQLTRLPASFGQLKHLSYLHLGACKKLDSLPFGFGGLSALDTLYINDCPILKALPKDFGDLSNLRVLKLNGNWDMTIPDGMEKLTELRELRMPNVKKKAGFPEFVRPMTKLKLLDVSMLVRPDEGAFVVPEWINELKDLEHFYMYNNKMSSLPDVLCQLTNLEFLNVGYNCLTTLPAGIKDLTTEINITINRIDIPALPPDVEDWIDTYTRQANWRDSQSGDHCR